MALGRSAALADPVGGISRDVDHLADVAMVALLQYLEDAGALVEPKPKKESPTPREAAILLCELTRSIRLDDPEVDHVQLLNSDAMVTYAWSQLRAGLSPEETTAANDALRVLTAYHRKPTP